METKQAAKTTVVKEFGVEVFEYFLKLHVKDENVVISPFTISQVLSLLSMVTEADTQAEILDVLDLEDSESAKEHQLSLSEKMLKRDPNVYIRVCFPKISFLTKF